MEMVTDHNPKLVSLLVLKWCIESKQRSPTNSFSTMQPSLSQFVLFLSNRVSGLSDSGSLPHFHIRSLVTILFFLYDLLLCTCPIFLDYYPKLSFMHILQLTTIMPSDGRNEWLVVNMGLWWTKGYGSTGFTKGNIQIGMARKALAKQTTCLSVCCHAVKCQKDIRKIRVIKSYLAELSCWYLVFGFLWSHHVG